MAPAAVLDGCAAAEDPAESVGVRRSWDSRHCLSKGFYGRSVPSVRLSQEPADTPFGVLSFE